MRTNMPTASAYPANSGCENCNLKQNGFLCHLTPMAAKEFESIKFSTRYPEGAILFLENEKARGIFLVCSGKVKLSVSSRGGKTLILQIAKPGEVFGLSASMSGVPYEVTAETLHPSEIVFIRREDFLQFIHRFPEAYEAVIRQLNLQYGRACEQLRTIGLSATAHEKLARLFLHWSSGEQQTTETNQIKVPLTHEQIASCLGSTRETVTRTLNDFKNRHLVTLRGTTVMIPDRSALMAISGD
jgi:CRP/FNR family transcriptional regulator, cyclic AMP receptor protein